jgi:hypothetical protein
VVELMAEQAEDEDFGLREVMEDRRSIMTF